MCALFLVAHASNTFSSALRKSETPNICQSFCVENVACLTVKVQWISFLCMHSFAVTAKSGALFSSCNFEVFSISGGKINLVHIFIPVGSGAVVL